MTALISHGLCAFAPRLSVKDEARDVAAFPKNFLSSFQSAEFQTTLGNDQAGHRFQEELNSLAHEQDKKVFFHSLLLFAQRLQEAEKIPAALEVYRNLSESKIQGLPEKVREQATRRLQAIVGTGRSSDRVEFLLNHFADQALAPEMLLSMIGAGALGKLAYAGLLGRFAASPAVMSFGKLGAQGLAEITSFAMEAPAFTLMTKGLGEALGNPSSWRPEDLENELWAGGIFLGAMKFSNFAGTRLWGVAARREGLAGKLQLDRFTQISGKLLPQATTFGGIVLAHKAQEYFHLKAPRENDTLFTDAFAELLQFAVAGRITHSLTGAGYRRWLQETELRAENAAELHRPTSDPGMISAWGTSLAVEGLGPWDGILQMSDHSGDDPQGPLGFPGKPREPVKIYNLRSNGDSPPILLQRQLEQLQQTASQIKSKTQRALSLSKVAEQWMRAGKKEAARQAFSQAAELLNSLSPLDQEKGLGFSQLARETARAGSKEAALRFFMKAMQVAEELKAQFSKTKDQQEVQESLEVVYTVAGDMLAAGLKENTEKILKTAHQIYRRFPEKTFPENLGESAVLALAQRGYREAAQELAKHLPDPESYGPVMVKLASIAAQQQDLQTALDILPLMQDAVDCDPLHRALALQLARHGQWPEAEFHLESLLEATTTIETYLEIGRMQHRLGDSLAALKLSSKASEKLKRLSSHFPHATRARLHALVATQLALVQDSEGFWDQYRLSHAAMEILHASQQTPEAAIDAVGELVFGLNRMKESDLGSQWMQSLDPTLRPQVSGKVALRLAEHGSASLARAWIQLIPEEHRSLPQKTLALKLLDLGMPDKALPLAETIPEARQRFDALYEIYQRVEPLP